MQAAILQIFQDRGGNCPEHSIPLPHGMRGVIQPKMSPDTGLALLAEFFAELSLSAQHSRKIIPWFMP